MFRLFISRLFEGGILIFFRDSEEDYEQELKDQEEMMMVVHSNASVPRFQTRAVYRPCTACARKALFSLDTRRKKKKPARVSICEDDYNMDIPVTSTLHF